MTKEYKTFVKAFHTKIIENGMTIPEAAAAIGTHPNTVYGWLSLRHIMSGEDILKIIVRFMDGVYWREYAER